MTRAPASAAPSAAPSPAGPPPTTRTSVSAASSAARGGKSMTVEVSGRLSGGINAVQTAFTHGAPPRARPEGRQHPDRSFDELNRTDQWGYGARLALLRVPLLQPS